MQKLHLTKKCRITFNSIKSANVNFTYKIERYQLIRTGNTQVSVVDSAKYLALNLEKRLQWKIHITNKTEESNIK